MANKGAVGPVNREATLGVIPACVSASSPTAKLDPDGLPTVRPVDAIASDFTAATMLMTVC